MTVAIGIKALNEEANIAACLESALAGVRPFAGHVVLADSGSHDRTVAIARDYPDVRVVQLANPEQRCCGAGAQLAYQGAGEAEFFYLLDGDMTILPGFLEVGIAFLRDHPGHAGVGGKVIEVNVESIEFEARARNDKAKQKSSSGDVDRLDCGGLYRMSTLRELDYFTDRNLHAFEEFDLGIRLIARGWKLARIETPAIQHRGHQDPALRLVWRRIRSGYAGGTGEVVRAAMAQGRLTPLLRGFSHLRHAAIVVIWWLALALCLVCGWWWAVLVLLGAPVGLLSLRRRSLRHGLYSLATWNMHGVGLLQGLGRGRVPPEVVLEMTVLQKGAP